MSIYGYVVASDSEFMHYFIVITVYHLVKGSCKHSIDEIQEKVDKEQSKGGPWMTRSSAQRAQQQYNSHVTN